MRQVAAAVMVAVAAAVACSSAQAQLANNYYAGKCGNASVEVEGIIQGVVQARVGWEKRIVPGLVHLLFHDCFVQGCDGSILLDGGGTEKTAPQNSGIFGYDLIDDIKAALEAVCPGVVSCADIIVAATRDAIALAGGPSYQVQLGRRDGTTSQAWAASQLPAPNVDIPTAINIFSNKGLNSFDMAILMGAHTVGVTHCSVIHDRLYNFNGSGGADPGMDPVYAWVLKTYACPTGLPYDNIVYLDDPSSILTFDRSYYAQIRRRRGVLPVDQALGDCPATAWMVDFLATTDFFPSMFAYAINKLAALDVKTAPTDGEIRTYCRRTN